MSDAARASLFAGTQQVYLEGSSIRVTAQNYSYKSYSERPKGDGFRALKEATAHAAFHNSGERHEPPKCHPCTREAILEKIMSWVKREIDTETFVFWLNGTVGVGKSAIAQTIAEMCEKEGLLLASFFFARSDPTRNNAKLLITSLAYQITLAIPPVRSRIEEVLEYDPLIDTRSLETQAVKLLVEPLEHAIADQIPIPPLIVIDGLDECHRTSEQSKVLDVISGVGGAVNVTSRRLVFLVASRPEQEISLKFNSRELEDVSSQYSVNTSPDSDDSIRRFLEDGFNKIKSTHPLKSSIPASWPSICDFEHLVGRAGGQFLYAALALSYISSIRHRSTDRLATILHAGAEAKDNPFTALDTLYYHIFSMTDNVESLLTILGLSISMTVTPRTVDMRDIVRKRLGMEFEDVKLLFGDLASVVEVNEGPPFYLILRHASLEEFLTNEKRSKEYHIQMGLHHTEWIIWWLEHDIPLDDSDELLEFVMHLKKCHPSPRLQAALQVHDICGLYAQHVWDDVSSADRMHLAISFIRTLEIDDADRLYQFQLGVFQHHLMSLLGSVNARPLTAFTVMLLLNTSALPQWQSIYTGNMHTGRALSCIFSCVKPMRSPSSWLLSDRFRSFLSTITMLHDSDQSTPLQCALNSIRIAAAPMLLHYLSRPPELAHTTPFEFKHFLEISDKLKISPWISRTRSFLRKKKCRMWCKLYKCCILCSRLVNPNCTHDDPDNTFWTLAHLSPTPPHILFLHDSPPLLAYFYALVLLPEVLAEAPRSEELITICKTRIFHRACILFPRRTKVARAAISKYLERMEEEERQRDIITNVQTFECLVS